MQGVSMIYKVMITATFLACFAAVRADVELENQSTAKQLIQENSEFSFDNLDSMLEDLEDKEPLPFVPSEPSLIKECFNRYGIKLWFMLEGSWDKIVAFYVFLRAWPAHEIKNAL
jgi:hypothetical protein